MQHEFPPYLRSEYFGAVMGMVGLPGHILEFGVYIGASINRIAGYFPDRVIHGFDSFEGLPEDWVKSPRRVTPKGRYRLGELPEVEKNVVLHVGWFEDSLPVWVEENPGPIALIHVDCDLYSSTKTVLTLLNGQMVPGTIIMFDELCPWGLGRYTNWREHEWKALMEWSEGFGRKFKPVAGMNPYKGAIRII